MEIRLAKESDLNSIIDFHIEQFEKYYLTQLGKDVLHSYYKAFIFHEENKCFLGFDEDKLVGLALFVLDFDEQITKFYKANTLLLGKSILFKLLQLNRIVLLGTYSRIKNVFSKNSENNQLPKLTLLSLAVSSSRRGEGIGKKLLESAESTFSAQHNSQYYLTVNSDNQNAIRFYSNYGFKKLFEADGNIFMEKTIDI